MLPLTRSSNSQCHANAVTRPNVDRQGPTSDATTVQVRDGKVLSRTAPFAETKEQIGDSCLIDCKDPDEAIQVAS